MAQSVDEQLVVVSQVSALIYLYYSFSLFITILSPD